jgi:hypothetical protein
MGNKKSGEQEYAQQRDDGWSMVRELIALKLCRGFISADAPA